MRAGLNLPQRTMVTGDAYELQIKRLILTFRVLNYPLQKQNEGRRAAKGLLIILRDLPAFDGTHFRDVLLQSGTPLQPFALNLNWKSWGRTGIRGDGQ